MSQSGQSVDIIGRLLLIGAAGGALLGVPTAFTMVSAQTPATPTEILDTPIVDGEDGSTIERSTDGLFYAPTRINGTNRRCLVDSGATELVLDAAEAKRLAPDAHPRFNGRLVTAAGSHPAARITLSHLSVAGRELHDVPTILVRGGNLPCLLGQSVLTRLDTVEYRGSSLHLR